MLCGSPWSLATANRFVKGSRAATSFRCCCFTVITTSTTTTTTTKKKKQRVCNSISSPYPYLAIRRRKADMVARCAFKSDDLVIKSPNDKRLYRVIELDNGLCGLLIHDPEIYPDGEAPPPPGDDAALKDGRGLKDMSEDDDDDEELDDDDDDMEEEDDDDDDDDEDEEEDDEDGEGEEGNGNNSQTRKAAAAMCVGVGSFLDPANAQGLAHFLGTSTFHTSKSSNVPFRHAHPLHAANFLYKRKIESDAKLLVSQNTCSLWGVPNFQMKMSYLSKHGGCSNAYTEAESTCYHFDVKPEFLKGALERFSQFFISPLVKSEAMEREVLAVDSEFNQVLQNDACRLQQIQCHTSEPGHPFNGFFWGNKKSLADAVDKGVDLREQILKLYNDYYHGGVMKLVVIGGESLDVLEDWVTELFANVRKGPRAQPTFQVEGPIWKAEGKGSLLSLFKARGWATSLSGGVGDDGMHRSSIAYVFGMSIHLTDSGLEKIFEIVGLVYQYVKLLRDVSPQEWIFKELQDIGNMEFRFVENQAQDDYAVDLAENLLKYPAEHVIYGDYVYKTWDGEKLKSILSFFKPENMRIDVVSKSFSNLEGFQLEPWFGSRYTEEQIPLPVMQLWSNPPEIDSSLHLPVKNDFIPSDFSIRADKSEQLVPRCIIDEPIMKFWYKLDSTFKHPRANTYFRINLKGGYDNVKNSLMTELFIHLLKDELNEMIYQASVAKLDTSVSFIGDKLELKVYGFNDKVSVLLSKVLLVAKSFMPADDRFKVIKEDVERGLKNANMKPLNHASYLRLQLLCKNFYDVQEKQDVLHHITLDDLRAFIPELRSQLYIEGLCHGNLLEEEALSIANIFKSNFAVQPLPVNMRHKEYIIRLPAGANLVRDVNVKNKSETNSVVELYFQIEPEQGSEAFKLKALIDLFDEIVQEPFFNQLRTKEQLGYVVRSSPRVTYRIHGFCYVVQSAKYNPVYLEGRVETFINGLEDLLQGLDESSFENYKNGLLSKLLEKDPSLQDETDRLWNQIVDQRYVFDFSLKEAEELKNITKSDVIEWCRMYMLQQSPKCRRLAVRVWGCEADLKELDKRPASEQVIKDLPAFKMSTDCYPSLC
ncbi:At1g06900 [Linum grandiflorum]